MKKCRIEKGFSCQNYDDNNKNIENFIKRIKFSHNPHQLSRIKIPKTKYFNHMKYTEIIKEFGEIPDDWIIFAVERNPYRKILSYTNMKINFSQYRRNGKPMKYNKVIFPFYLNRFISNGKIKSVKI